MIDTTQKIFKCYDTIKNETRYYSLEDLAKHDKINYELEIDKLSTWEALHWEIIPKNYPNPFND